ncbi:MAG TPA: YbaN family protein [Pyrinomonadaceae bacterium]|nr:YbaN family protein [Pyrinomonadaceae bacterium]
MDVRKILLIFLGTVCVALGVLGMFLPLLPTTVFLLAAAYCYSKSSERFHNWLLTNKLCGKYISNYKSGRGMTVRNKVTSLLSLWVSIGISMWLVYPKAWLEILLAAIALGITIHILWIKTHSESDEQVTADINGLVEPN